VALAGREVLPACSPWRLESADLADRASTGDCRTAPRVCLIPSRCAIWARVSTDDQDISNQLAELRAWAGRRGLDIAPEYVLDGASAWKGQHRDQLTSALAGARTGRYDVLLV
jgi:Resolvase, N terminal domain